MSEIPKSLYRRLVDRMTRKRVPVPEAGPLGLRADQVEALEGLIRSPLWRSWQAVLETLLEQRMARLASGLPHDEYLKLSGETRLLIQLAHLPETITATERVRHERQHPVQRDASHFVNSPCFATGTLSDSNGRSTSMGPR